jgi:Tat protein secretion system quality control protein TatD with DNase activity
MKQFSELGIKPTEQQGFTGEKVKMHKVLNRTIVVHGFKIEPSKHNKGNCLYMQISIGGTKHVLFTGSTYLIDMIQQVPKEAFPFETTIIEDNERFKFT